MWAPVRSPIALAVDGFADAIAAMLDDDPRVAATVIAQRLRPLGFGGSDACGVRPGDGPAVQRRVLGRLHILLAHRAEMTGGGVVCGQPARGVVAEPARTARRPNAVPGDLTDAVG